MQKGQKLKIECTWDKRGLQAIICIILSTLHKVALVGHLFIVHTSKFVEEAKL